MWDNLHQMKPLKFPIVKRMAKSYGIYPVNQFLSFGMRACFDVYALHMHICGCLSNDDGNSL